MDKNEKFFKLLLSDTLEGLLTELDDNGYDRKMFSVEIKIDSDYYGFKHTINKFA